MSSDTYEDVRRGLINNDETLIEIDLTSEFLEDEKICILVDL